MKCATIDNMNIDIGEEVLKKEISGKSYYESLKSSELVLSDEGSRNFGKITQSQSKVVDAVMEALLANKDNVHNITFSIPFSNAYWPLSEVRFTFNDVLVVVNPKRVKIAQQGIGKAITMPTMQFSIDNELDVAISSVEGIVKGQS